MQSNKRKKRFVTLFRDDEKLAYDSLSPEEHRAILSGGRHEVDGLTFYLHPETKMSSGVAIQAIVCERSEMPAAEREAQTAYEVLSARHAETWSTLSMPHTVEDSMRAFTQYSQAWQSYNKAVLKRCGASARDAKRTAQLDVALPALLAKEAARAKGKAKIKADPTAKAKAEAKVAALQLWKEREAGKHPKLRTVEQFAIEVMRRSPVLTSPKVICGWSANWTKQVKAGKKPVC